MGGTRLYEFGSLRFDPATRVLFRDGKVVRLPRKALDLLLVLVENRDRVVEKQELMQAVWPGTFVEEGNLTQNISLLRKALGEGPEECVWIETIPRCGYRFTGPCREVEAAEPLARPRAARRWIWLLIPAIGGLSAAGYLWWRSREVPPMVELRPVPLTAYPGYEDFPSFSPDGTQVAFAWGDEQQKNWNIYVKLIGSEKLLRLTSDPAPDQAPAWSPDGRWIAFLRRLGPLQVELRVIPSLGGPERKLADLSTVRDRPPSWSPDSKWLAVSQWASDGTLSLSVVAAASGEVRRLTAASRVGEGDDMAAFSPDGAHIAFRRRLTYSTSAIFVLPLSADMSPAGQPRQLTDADDTNFYSDPAWMPD